MWMPCMWQGGGELFGQPAPAQSNPFALTPVPQAQQQQPSAQYQVLVTKDNKPILHSTAWDDIHPEGQKYLLELECESYLPPCRKRCPTLPIRFPFQAACLLTAEGSFSLCRKQVLQYREESRQLDECERLKDSRQLKQVWHCPDHLHCIC